VRSGKGDKGEKGEGDLRGAGKVNGGLGGVRGRGKEG